MDEHLQEIIDRVHLPEDAGEYADGLTDVMQRIPRGWGRWISCNKGWYKIICETNEMMKYIDPDYEVHQVKEKFGTLRYYYGTTLEWNSVPGKIMQVLERRAEDLSSITCELCGKSKYGALAQIDETVKLQTSLYYVRTLCSTCAIADGYDPDAEDGED